MTDPTPQTTPTRDEAVLAGWKLVPIEPTPQMAWAGVHQIGDIAASGVPVWKAMLASAPAPASGGVDVPAVELLARALFALEEAREELTGYEKDATGEGYNCVELNDTIGALRASLSPAATPVSEAICNVVPPPETYGGSPGEPWTGRLSEAGGWGGRVLLRKEDAQLALSVLDSFMGDTDPLEDDAASSEIAVQSQLAAEAALAGTNLRQSERIRQLEAALAAERERCAKIVEADVVGMSCFMTKEDWAKQPGVRLAAAIRAQE